MSDRKILTSLADVYASMYNQEETVQSEPEQIQEQKSSVNLNEIYEEALSELAKPVAPPVPENLKEENLKPLQFRGEAPQIPTHQPTSEEVDGLCLRLYAGLNESILLSTMKTSEKLMNSFADKLKNLEEELIDRRREVYMPESKQDKKEVIKEELLTNESEEKPLVQNTSVPKSYIDLMAEDLGKFAKKQDSNSMRQNLNPALTEDALTDPKYFQLEQQIKQLRTMMMEASHKPQTLVSAIGSGGVGTTPGSGEVNLTKMDDVAQGPGVQWYPGATLVWDGEQFVPSIGFQGPQGPQTTDGFVAIGPVPPAIPEIGDLWYNDVIGVLYVYYFDGGSTQWVDTNSRPF